MLVKCSYSDLSETIQKQLEGYEWKLLQSINNALKETAEYGANQLKTPRAYHDRSGKYSGDWAVKTGGYQKDSRLYSENYVIHNVKHYRLTHLLEYGHIGRNGKRVQAFQHIKPVEELVTQKALSEVERVIRENAN